MAPRGNAGVGQQAPNAVAHLADRQNRVARASTSRARSSRPNPRTNGTVVDRIAEVREFWNSAVARMEDLVLEIDNLPDDAPDKAVEILEQKFLFASSEADGYRAQVDHLVELASAGQLDEQLAADDERRQRLRDARHRLVGTSPGGTPMSSTTPAGASPAVSIGREPMTYDRGKDTSFFRDLVRMKLDGDLAAHDRLQRHLRELDVVREHGTAEQRVFLSSTDGTGGDFVAPVYLFDDWLPVVRAGRPFANAVTQRPLPPNTDTLTIPRLATGSAMAAQADLGAVLETDPTTAALTVGVKTVAGQVTMSRQLLDRGQPGMDQVIFADLASDYDLRIDLQCVTGGGTGANAKGVLSDSNRIQVTYTDGTPTVGELYLKIADATQQVVTNRGLPANLIVMHPRRWSWFSAALDSSQRPLIVPAGGNGQNAWGAANTVGGFDPNSGFVGTLFGLPVITDANVPTNLGAGTNEDTIIITRREDVWLMEDTPLKTRIDESVASANLNVVLQAYNYFAFTTERFSKATATIGGTGLVAPTF
jgi:HK97 family phage major capsid protein